VVSEQRKWFDSSQPQTLQGALVLSYLTAAFGLLWLVTGAFPLLVIPPLALAVPAVGIANEKRWAYGLGIGLAGLNVLLNLIFLPKDWGLVINLFFAVALFALLVHPQSREYQRIWFK
jgi:hypothetical protein